MALLTNRISNSHFSSHSDVWSCRAESGCFVWTRASAISSRQHKLSFSRYSDIWSEWMRISISFHVDYYTELGVVETTRVSWVSVWWQTTAGRYWANNNCTHDKSTRMTTMIFNESAASLRYVCKPFIDLIMMIAASERAWCCCVVCQLPPHHLV